MIQPVGKGENSINSIFDMNWDKFAAEADAINDKYNQPKKQEVRLAKQTSGSMYSTKNQHRIAFPFEENGGVVKPDIKPEKDVEMTGTRKLQRSFNPKESNYLQSSKSVSSIEHTASEGSNRKYLKSESSNSIWNSNKLQEMAQDSQDRVREEKEAQESAKRTMRQQAHDNLVEALQSIDQRKASHISSVSDIQASEEAVFDKPTRNMSIFDFLGNDNPQDFARLETLSEGESLSRKKAARKEEVAQDDSWKSGGKIVSSKSVTDRLFDALNRSE